MKNTAKHYRNTVIRYKMKKISFELKERNIMPKEMRSLATKAFNSEFSEIRENISSKKRRKMAMEEGEGKEKTIKKANHLHVCTVTS